MAAAQIVVDQAGKPAGVAGKAREDLDLAVDIVLASAGGPFAAHLWSIIDKPIDIVGASQSASLLSSPASSTTILSPIDLKGTYLLELLVDSGDGIGATADDIARITFYAGAVLNADPLQLPRRIPAFRETLEHNVNDVIFPSGNSRGWSQEWLRWFAILENVATSGGDFAYARVSLTGGGASLVGNSDNVANVTRLGLGNVRVDFNNPAPNANYGVIPTARGPTGGSCTTDSETVNDFEIFRANPGGTLVDADFTFIVKSV